MRVKNQGRLRSIRSYEKGTAVRSMPKMQSLEKWFDRLAHHNMHGPALATAEVAVELIIMTAGLLPWGWPAQAIVVIIGLAQVAASSIIFVAFAILKFVESL